MRAAVSFAALASILLLLNGTQVFARKKEAADPGTTYLDCLQRGKSAAAQDNPAALRSNILADCLLLRRATATVTEALLILDGATQKHANAKVDDMMASDDQKGLGISRQDDDAIFAAYGTLEKQLATAKAEYRMHPDGHVDCVLTHSSGDSDVDATECKSMQGCPPLDSKDGANNNPVLICMGNEQRRQLLLLAVRRAGLESPSVSNADSALNH